ncbi:hypothetical protein GCM10022403_028130 [Streptomyces coacervatus]|uniref:CN hydrolase domain-containing protein n=1 Tax=Streptomyces coacervatus TaxID=647381 RepID=A0ABP7HG92_9ACTN|nr:hypothetical protein [Streptomyces coacervatus]MDF2265452.1 hypothetical protein [Streptomyces coacervatus]
MNEEMPRAAVHSINGVELTADPADLFVILYDLLPEERFRADEAIDWLQDLTVREKADHICRQVLQTGRVTEKLAGDIVREVDNHGHLGMFTALVGLDRALAAANPFNTRFNDPTMDWLRVRYIRHNRLNTPRRTTGLLLPRCARPGKVMAEWENKTDFFNVHRVTPDDCRRIRLSRIPALNDPGFKGEESISIGAVPIVERYTDLKFEWERKGPGRRYRITPSEDLGVRIGSAVRNLWQSGAEIGVLPESTVSTPLLKNWKNALRELPQDSGLRWLLVGTGPLTDTNPPPNRAVLIDCRTREVILRQDKMAGFTVTTDLADQWRLPGGPHQGLAREDINRGTEITVLESSLGRLAVFICEDIKQSVRWAAQLQALGVSHIFVPLFAAPILRARPQWERQAAQRCIEELGAWVVLSNSLAVGAEMKTPDYVEPGDGFNCVVVGPRTHKATTYADYDTQFCRADSAVDVSRVHYRNDTPQTAEDGMPLPLPTLQPGWSEVEPAYADVDDEPDWGEAG